MEGLEETRHGGGGGGGGVGYSGKGIGSNCPGISGTVPDF